MSPPRYARNDPRNQARVYAGHLLSMQLRGYDYPIRKLRRVGDVCYVTLPPQVRDSLKIRKSDNLMFGEGPWPGTIWISKVTPEWKQALTLDERWKFRKTARIVQGKRRGVWIAVPPAFRKRMSAEPGDFLMFGVRPGMNLVHICAVKGGDGSTGVRRSG